ncbi:potassium transporter TrkA [Nocardioides mangrovicus]|uniref:Potassium transporter TrkA n=1 Tax=Nocardioides mangrovicus TaxID=2478913 RepID=A0A3L8P788_9ACTN|nr:NAD-binding protein [Nocardioides mangrovicus]RLV50802.1 potassium transporter TrkA [Nocardioides mangrovicus]
MTDHLEGHVIVCGLHDDGMRLVEQLRLAGATPLVVDDEPDRNLPHLLAGMGVELLREDSRLESTLRAAGVERAAALVCTESDDLHTLATALLARELRPDLTVVAQLRNAAVARALEDIGVRVLDAAALAAPSVAEACLREESHRLEVAGQEFLVVRAEVARECVLREAYGDLAPLALERAGGEVLTSPGRDERAAPGDVVVLVGPEADVRAAGLGAQDAPAMPAFVGARAPRVGPRRTTLVRFLIRDMDRRFKIAIATLLGLMALSVTLLMVGYREPDGTRMSFVDALYFTVETIGTVGFGDFYFRDQHTWLRIWAIVLMLVGATLAAVVFALVTNALIGQTIAQALGRRRLTGLSGHVVVAGAGAVGMAVVDLLRGWGHDVAVVEVDEDNRFLSQLRARHVPVIIADATLPDTWSTARLDEARAVAVMTSDDMANIETGLAVRDLLEGRDLPVVLRTFDPRLQRTVSHSLAFSDALSPSALAAPWFVGAALGFEVRQTFYVAGRPVLVAMLDVPPRSPLVGRPMNELPARIRVVSLHRASGEDVHLPRRDVRFEPGDRATLAGPYEELLVLMQHGLA